MTEHENTVRVLLQHHGLRHFQLASELGLIPEQPSLTDIMDAIERVKAIESGDVTLTKEQESILSDLVEDAQINTFYVELLRSEKELTRAQRDAIAKYLRVLVAG